jgi:hypothetical protein
MAGGAAAEAVLPEPPVVVDAVARPPLLAG